MRSAVQLENRVENQKGNKENSVIADASFRTESEIRPHSGVMNDDPNKILSNADRAPTLEKWYLWREVIEQGDKIRELEREVDRRIVKEIEEYKRRKECDRFCRQTPPEDDGYEYVDD